MLKKRSSPKDHGTLEWKGLNLCSRVWVLKIARFEGSGYLGFSKYPQHTSRITLGGIFVITWRIRFPGKFAVSRFLDTKIPPQVHPGVENKPDVFVFSRSDWSIGTVKQFFFTAYIWIIQSIIHTIYMVWLCLIMLDDSELFFFQWFCPFLFLWSAFFPLMFVLNADTLSKPSISEYLWTALRAVHSGILPKWFKGDGLLFATRSDKVQKSSRKIKTQ